MVLPPEQKRCLTKYHGKMGHYLIIRGVAILLACALALPLGGCAAKQKEGGDSTVIVRLAHYSPKAPDGLAPAEFVDAGGKVLHGPALAEALARADYVLVGETHDKPVDHKAQAALVESMSRAGRTPAIGLEMLPRNRHDATLRRFSRGGIKLDDLPPALDWQTSWGFDFALYRPVFEVAARYGLPLYGLNIDNDLRRAVSRKGLYGLTRQEMDALPLAVIFPLPAQEKELGAFFSAHSAMIGQQAKGGHGPDRAKTRSAEGAGQAGAKAKAPRPAAQSVAGEAEHTGATARLERFLLIQSIWDSMMAEQAARLRRAAGGPMVILAGGGHVENGYGIAHRLRVWDKSATVLIVMPFSGDLPRTGADLFYYSPERKRIGLRFEDDGDAPRIAAVVAGSAAEKAGLKAGDRILGVGGARVRNAAELHRAVVDILSRGEDLPLMVRRNGGGGQRSQTEKLSVSPDAPEPGR